MACQYAPQLCYCATMHLIAVATPRIFAALADQTRLRIVRLMAQTDEEVCLCELVDSLQEPQYKLSRHVRDLREAGILNAEREGRWIYHRLVRREAHLRKLYATVLSLPDSDGVFQGDVKRFNERMRLRDGGRCRVGIQTKRLAALAG